MLATAKVQDCTYYELANHAPVFGTPAVLIQQNPEIWEFYELTQEQCSGAATGLFARGPRGEWHCEKIDIQGQPKWIHRTGLKGDDQIEAIIYDNPLGNCEQNAAFLEQREIAPRYCISKKLGSVPNGCDLDECNSTCYCQGSGSKPQCSAGTASCCSNGKCISYTIPCPY